jgi:hypothetical protein
MIMLDRATKLSLIILAVFFLSVLPVTAGITTISQGNTVFLGEEGLDVSGFIPSGTTIGWWASGAAFATTSPDDTYVISNAAQFSVAPFQFGSHTGSWYILPAKTPAFTIADPYLNLRVEDTTVGVDVTQNKWVYRGDIVGFRIETNLNAIAQRTGNPSVPVTIKVQTPDGGVYTSLVNGGASTLIDPYPITTSPQETGPIWDTGNSAYTYGTYTIWAECNANRMKDNYPSTGKTISAQTSMGNQEQNPLIRASVPTTISTTPVTTVKTTVKTTIPMPTPSPTTSVITPSPTSSGTTVVEPSATTPAQTPTTTPTKAPGFGSLIAIISISMGAAILVKKRS